MTAFSLSFSGSIPENYDRYIFPLNIKPFAEAMAERIALMSPSHVLETAAGTGACTEYLLSALPEATEYTASDISPVMLEIAQKRLASHPQITFEQVDACQLPYADHQFDLMLSMYGMMFYDDKIKALSEARRVLKPGGLLLTAVWDALQYNTLHSTFYSCLEKYAGNQHRAFQDIPHNCSNLDMTKQWLEAAGFTDFSFHVVRCTIGPVPTVDACKGYILGTPLYHEFMALNMDPEEILRAVSSDLITLHGEMLTGFHRQAIFIEARQ